MDIILNFPDDRSRMFRVFHLLGRVKTGSNFVLKTRKGHLFSVKVCWSISPLSCYQITSRVSLIITSPPPPPPPQWVINLQPSLSDVSPLPSLSCITQLPQVSSPSLVSPTFTHQCYCSFSLPLLPPPASSGDFKCIRIRGSLPLFMDFLQAPSLSSECIFANTSSHPLASERPVDTIKTFPDVTEAGGSL